MNFNRHLLIVLMMTFRAAAADSWTRLPTVNKTTNMQSVHFVNSQRGFALKLSVTSAYDYGYIIGTTDGGKTWSGPLTDTTKLLYDIHFANTNVGYAVGIKGLILKTVDSGNTWSTVLNGSKYLELYSIQALDDSVAYAAGRNDSNSSNQLGVILKTTNGGSSWSPQIGDSSYKWFGNIFFLTRNLGYAIGYSYPLPLVLKTTNGGASWSRTNLGSLVEQDTSSPSLLNNKSLSSLYFINESFGFLVGTNNYTHRTDFSYYSRPLIYATTDGGETWSNRFNNLTFCNFWSDCGFTDVAFQDSLNGYVVGILGASSFSSGYVSGGMVWKTSDGGLTWSNQVRTVEDVVQPSGFHTFNSIHFPTPDTGYVVGDSGVVFMHAPNPVNVRPAPPRSTSTLINLGNGRYGYTLPTPTRVQIRLLDSRGRLVLRLPASEKTTGYHTGILPLSSLPPGIFTLELKGGEDIQTLKMTHLER